MRDEAMRASCFAQLAILVAEHGDEVPYTGGLDRGFRFGGERIPYLNRQKGIYRSARQRGEAALSIQTSYNSPYSDVPTADGFVYAYRAGAADQPDNRALRSAFALQVPLVYYVATAPGVFLPIFPAYITHDDPAAGTVIVSLGVFRGPLDEQVPVAVPDEAERRYAFRQTRVRLHQHRFRRRVLPAYRHQCAVCRLKEARLLDAAHIAGDLEAAGEPTIANGLSLCTIHHRAYDNDLVGIAPDYRVRVAPRLLDDEDGPMLELLKGADGALIEVPSRRAWQPDRELLAARFDRFVAAAG